MKNNRNKKFHCSNAIEYGHRNDDFACKQQCQQCKYYEQKKKNGRKNSTIKD